MRLSSSGMRRSKLRSPASTCATGICCCMAATDAAMVEVTSPTTTNAAGRSPANRGSRRRMISEVCAVAVPPPTSRLISGSGISNSRKKASDISGGEMLARVDQPRPEAALRAHLSQQRRHFHEVRPRADDAIDPKHTCFRHSYQGTPSRFPAPAVL